jgi:hypothetical protein
VEKNMKEIGREKEKEGKRESKNKNICNVNSESIFYLE